MAFTSKLLKNMKKRNFIVICILASVVFIILNTNLGAELNLMIWGADLEINISCHYIDNNDVVPELGKGYKPQPRSIFFHETTCRGNLTSRQACAVESAARAHPDWDIHVLFSSPISKHALEHGSLKEIHAIKNVKLMRIKINDYAMGTPLEELVIEGALNKSLWKVEHTSDVLRYLTLYKWGGVYMDLDFVVVRSVASLSRNWAARECDSYVAAGILAFSRDAVGRNIADMAIRDISDKFRGDMYGNSPAVITRVLRDICSTDNPGIMSSATCNGFEVYAPQFFYPLSWERSKEYFTSGDLDLQNAYTHHFWNYITKEYKIQPDSPYAKLARRFCPTTYKLYGDNFGN